MPIGVEILAHEVNRRATFMVAADGDVELLGRERDEI